MTKITIISCIIAAVCVFQTAEAGLLDTSGLGSILGNVKNQVTDTLGHTLGDALGNVKKVEEGVQNGGLFDGIKNGAEAAQKALQTSTTCTNAYNVGQKAFTGLISSIKSCFSNAIKSANGDVQKLPEDLINLLSGYGKWGLDGLNCFKQPLKVTECFSTISQDINDLGPNIQQIVDLNVEIVKLFQSLGVCYRNAFLQTVGPIAAQLIKDGQQCASNVVGPLIKLLN